MDKDVLKKSMLCEAFKGAIENENLKEAFARAFITSLCYYKTDKKIEMSIECCDCVGPDQIKGLERAISKHLKTKVKIYPGFPSTLNGSFEKWQKELVFSRVKSEKTHFHHFLEGAEFDLSGRYLSIKLKTQASAILNAAGVGKSIETAIQRLFDKDVSVSFIDSTENEKNVDYMARKQEMEARLIAEAMAAVPVNGRNGDDWHVPEPPPLDEPPVRYRTKKTKNIEKDPDLIFGKGIKGQVIKMSQVDTNSGQVTIQGRILKTEQRQLKTGRTLFTFDITDMTSSLTCKIFVSDKELEIISGKLVKDQHVCLSGEAQYDMYAKELVVLARDIRLVDMETEARMDLAPQKRVELHLHTQMSQLDAICGTKELIKRAAKWGHKAIAITDHGVVQAFPEAQDTANELKKKQKKDIKIIYGVEAYFIADEKYNSKGEVDYRHCDTYHAVILVKNQTGLKNLYRIVSESHLNYFYKRPRIPKSLFEKYREGLLIGSACEAGELFQAVYKGFPE